jgi:hypothetical protein
VITRPSIARPVERSSLYFLGSRHFRTGPSSDAVEIVRALEPVPSRGTPRSAGSAQGRIAVAYDVEVAGDASPERLERLVTRVDEIAENPNSLRVGTPVKLGDLRVG